MMPSVNFPTTAASHFSLMMPSPNPDNSQYGGHAGGDHSPQGAAAPGLCRPGQGALHRFAGGVQGLIGPFVLLHQGHSSPFKDAASLSRPRDSQLFTVPSLAPMRAATSATE